MKMSLVQTALSSLLLCSVLSAEVPQRSYAGQTLVAPDGQLDQGFVYHTQPGEDTQLVLRVESELQKLSFSTSRIVGYLVIPFEVEEAEIPILAGGFRIPAQSFRTSADASFFSPSCGGCQADVILAGSDYLDSDTYPEITFEVTGISDVKLESRTENRHVYGLEIAGQLTIKGQTREIAMPATLTLRPSTRETMSRNVGDIATLKTSITLAGADWGWEPSPYMRATLPEQVKVEIFLMMNTISPDKSGNPNDDPERHRKFVRYFTLARDLNDPVAARAFGTEYLRAIWDNQPELSRFARALVSTGGIQHRNLHFALKVARRADELASSKTPGTLARVAQIYYEIGDLESAIQWQKKAAALVEGDGRKAESVKATLAEYEKELGQQKIISPQSARRTQRVLRSSAVSR